MRFLRISLYLLTALLLLMTGMLLGKGEHRRPGAFTETKPQSDELHAQLADLRRRLAEREKELATLKAALPIGFKAAGAQQELRPAQLEQQTVKPLAAKEAELSKALDGPASSIELNGGAQPAVLQVDQFQFEQQQGRVLVKDEKGNPAFVFDAERRSIIAPNGVYIPSERRMVVADEPPRNVKSLDAKEPVKVGFKNETASRLDMAWVNYEGKLVYYKTLNPGESYQQNTYATHPWVTLDRSGKILDVINPSKQDENAEFIFAPTPKRATP